MRVLGALLVIASAFIDLLLGGGYVVSSRYEEMKAELDTGDLSSVSADLGVSQAELDKMHAVTKAKHAGRRHVILAIVLFASALTLLTSGLLLLLRRARRLALGGAVAGLVAVLAGALLLDHLVPLAIVSLALLAVGTVAALLSRPRVPAEPQTT